MLCMTLLCIVIFALLIVVGGISPQRSVMSKFELERRIATGDKIAVAASRREQLLVDILSLQRVVLALLLVVFAVLSVGTLGWLLGTIVAAIVALEYGTLAQLSIVRHQSQRLYTHYEKDLLHLIEKFSITFRLIRNVTSQRPVARHPDSREELEHIVKQSGALLTSDEKKRILSGLQFNTRLVSEIMTPRGMIDSISKKELLGPLVLDDLHKTGHSRFPVTNGDIDHVVGMLYIQNLLTLDAKQRSTTAEKAMEPRVFYIHENQTLSHSLAAFLRTHHHLFIVVNEFRETVGLLSLEDVVEALLGRKIIDEFDGHEDLRAVARRNPRVNTHFEKYEDD